jgi:hypothetical protein
MAATCVEGSLRVDDCDKVCISFNNTDMPLNYDYVDEISGIKDTKNGNQVSIKFVYGYSLKENALVRGYSENEIFHAFVSDPTIDKVNTLCLFQKNKWVGRTKAFTLPQLSLVMDLLGGAEPDVWLIGEFYQNKFYLKLSLMSDKSQRNMTVKIFRNEVRSFDQTDDTIVLKFSPTIPNIIIKKTLESSGDLIEYLRHGYM